jgi:hypothetical protein
LTPSRRFSPECHYFALAPSSLGVFCGLPYNDRQLFSGMEEKKASDSIKFSGLQKSDVIIRDQKNKRPSDRAKAAANPLGAFLPSSGRATADFWRRRKG